MVKAEQAGRIVLAKVIRLMGRAEMSLEDWFAFMDRSQVSWYLACGKVETAGVSLRLCAKISGELFVRWPYWQVGGNAISALLGCDHIQRFSRPS